MRNWYQANQICHDGCKRHHYPVQLASRWLALIKKPLRCIAQNAFLIHSTPRSWGTTCQNSNNTHTHWHLLFNLYMLFTILHSFFVINTPILFYHHSDFIMCAAVVISLLYKYKNDRTKTAHCHFCLKVCRSFRAPPAYNLLTPTSLLFYHALCSRGPFLVSHEFPTLPFKHLADRILVSF